MQFVVCGYKRSYDGILLFFMCERGKSGKMPTMRSVVPGESWPKDHEARLLLDNNGERLPSVR